jgi:hypothetical protein
MPYLLASIVRLCAESMPLTALSSQRLDTTLIAARQNSLNLEDCREERACEGLSSQLFFAG